MKYMAAALDRSHVSGSEKEEFLTLIDSLKPMFVEKH
jgi:hypothetical protein